MGYEVLKSARITFQESLDEIQDAMYSKGMTDGLPIIPPTEERVMKMIEYNKLDPQMLVGPVEPARGQATVEKIAINAVMAGCLPEYLPVVIAAVEAWQKKGFDLFGVQATTHPCGMIAIINGPIRDKLKINYSSGCMGPGWRANATIGRAIRLVMLNIGGAAPGPVDKSTQGSPCKFSFCFGENEAENPWEPFHVERGYDINDSTITVVGMEAPHDINGQDGKCAKDVCRIIASSIMSPGSSNFRFRTGSDMLVVFGPEHASFVARDGWTKKDVQEYLFEHSQVPFDLISETHIEHRRKAPGQFGEFGDRIPVVLSPDNIKIVVAGGPGLHSCWMPNWGGPRHQFSTAKIKMPD